MRFDALTNALGPAGSALLALSVAIALGLALGRVQVRGVRLGVAGVLFAALALAEAGVSIEPEALPFVRDFALVLLVYAIGLQVGPGFIASFRAEGLRLNLLATAVLVIGAAAAAWFTHVFALPRDGAMGVYAGAFNSTPGLAGGQVVVRQLLAADPGRVNAVLASSSLAYAVTYVFGVVGPILLVVVLRRVFRVRMQDERSALATRDRSRRAPSVIADIEIEAGAHAGRTVRDLPATLRGEVVLSRHYRGGTSSVPRANTVLRPGDRLRVVGAPEAVRSVVVALGRPSALDLSQVAGAFRRADLLVTKTGALRRPLRDLALRGRTGVTISHVLRSGVELIPHGGTTLKFGDRVTVVGPEDGIRVAAEELGNEPEALERPYLFPVFVGIALGVLVGAIPFTIPGLPAPLQIGLAGGPFLVAIALSQLGSIGSVVWYMPVAANQMVRDMGLCIFLACVGFQSGGGLVERAADAGVGLVLAGAAVTLLPALVVACVARWLLRMNFITLTGWLSGTMTSTPALLYATEEARSDAPALAYAAVAPLGELLPIVCAEIVALVVRS